MIRYERTMDIDAPTAAVWTALARYMHIDEFAPQVTKVEALTDGEVGIGSQRRCIFENGESVVEQVIDWKPNRGYRVQLQDLSSMPLIQAYADVLIEPGDAGPTRATWAMDYQVKFGPFGWLLGHTLMKLMLGKIFDGNLKGLAEYVQTQQSLTAQTA